MALKAIQENHYNQLLCRLQSLPYSDKNRLPCEPRLLRVKCRSNQLITDLENTIVRCQKLGAKITSRSLGKLQSAKSLNVKLTSIRLSISVR